MLGDAAPEQPSSQLGQAVSSPLSTAQILEFCESDLFPPDSEVASTSNDQDHSSYPPDPAPNINDNFSIIFDEQDITHDSSVNLDLTSNQLIDPYQQQFDLSLFENQQLPDHCNMMMNYAPPPYTTVPQHDYLSNPNPNYMPPAPCSKVMQFNNHPSPNCSFTMDPSYLPLQDFGIFNSNLFLEAGDGIFSPDTMPYNPTQAHSNESQHVVVNGTLASEMTTSLEGADTYRVTTKLTTEERKEKINRYMKKRNHRNFTKKIKYACRKTLADSRPRVRGRFAKNDEFGENVNNRSTAYHHQVAEDTDYEHVKSSSYHHVVVKEEEEMNYESPSADIFAHISGLNSFKSNNNYPIQSWI